MNEESEKLNESIKKANNSVYNMLSDKGKAIFFPKKGILSQSADAKGKNINATIGVALEDDGSPLILSTISKKVSLTKKEIFDYAPSYGNPDLRKTWKEMIYQKNNSLNGKNFSTPVVTAALTHGLSVCGYMFCNKNDKILIPDPYWENYNLIFENAYNSKIQTFPLFKKSEFNVEGLRKKLLASGEKKILLLNFPNNPTGYTPRNDEVPKIVSAIKEAADFGKKVVVLIDDAYFGLVYQEGIYKESLFSELCNLSENVLAVKLDGATKEDYVWGLRVGFITYGVKEGNEELYKALEDKTAGAIRGNISNAPQISQSLILHSFKDADYKDEKHQKYETLKKRYDKVCEILSNHKEYKKYFKALSFNSGYFMCIETKSNAEKIRITLLNNYSTGVIVFGEHLIRIAFSATPHNKLEELFENIYHASKQAVEKNE